MRRRVPRPRHRLRLRLLLRVLRQLLPLLLLDHRLHHEKVLLHCLLLQLRLHERRDVGKARRCGPRRG